MEMKHIVCSGCSFTRQEHRIGINGTDIDFMKDSIGYWRWPHYLQDIYSNVKVYNYGNPTNDNRVILLSIIKKVQELLNGGVKSSDIFVITQWSDVNRKSFFISEKIAKEYNSTLKYKDIDENAYAHISAFYDNCDDSIGENGYFIQSGGYHYPHVIYPVVDVFDKLGQYHSVENSYIEFFEIVLNLQNYLKSNCINYIQFNLSYNFNQESEHLSFRDVYYDKKIVKSHFDFKYNNPYIQLLYDLVDMDKFYLYSDEYTNNGGITEWAIRNFNVNTDEQLFMEHNLLERNGIDNFIKEMECRENEWPYGHPSNLMNKKFILDVLSSYLKDFL